jgi:xanthine dehydrogenase YagS FAD-binding subunit
MRPFAYDRAGTARDAVARLGGGATALGGGTDLLVLIKEELANPSGVVDLRQIEGWRGISDDGHGGLVIGAATRVNDLATSALVRSSFPALAQACESVATPAIRHMATIGGNLCQRPRCWYFRRKIPCLKNGGTECPAAVGENQYHAILDGGPCYIVHPSDPAVALVALDASVDLLGPSGTRTLPIEDFFVLPRERLDHETVLEPGEVVSRITIPPESRGQQRYDKLMQRGSWDFALVSIAAVRRSDGDIRLVLGGVAPVPWRVNTSIEEDVAAGNLDGDTIATLVDRALYDARPLAKNGYKVRLAETLLRRAMEEFAT